MNILNKDNEYLSQSKGTYQNITDMATPYLVNIANKTDDSDDLHAIIHELASRPHTDKQYHAMTKSYAKKLPEPDDVEEIIRNDISEIIELRPLLEAAFDEASAPLTDGIIDEVESLVSNALATYVSTK